MVSKYIIFAVCQLIIQSLVIVANSMTIVAFIKVRSLRAHTSNVLVYALSITDLCWGTYQFLYLGVPFIFGFGPPLGEIGCMISVPLDYVYNAGNVLLVCISVDRALFVTMDYAKYIKMSTNSRFRIMIATCYLICFLASLIELSLWNFAKRNNANAASINFNETCLYPPRRMKWIGLYISVCFFLLPLVLVGFFSAVFFNRLLVRINKSRRIGNVPSANSAISNVSNVISASNVPSSASNATDSRDTESATTHTSNDDTAATVRRRYIKPAVTLAALVSAMGISMLPYCIYLLVVALSGSFSSDVTNIMWLVLQLNPLLDPLFYAATQKGIREYYGNKIRGLCRSLGACSNPM